MKTNIALTMSEKQEKTLQECKECNLSECSLAGGDKVRDHGHLTEKFRQTFTNLKRHSMI